MTDCGKCGDCCEDIHVSTAGDEILKGWIDGTRPLDSGPDGEFIAAHWTRTKDWETRRRGTDDPWEVTGGTYSCSAFDPETRTCTAHDTRPLVCRGYPWYSNGPSPDVPLPGRCSFNQDIPTRRLLPLTVIERVR